MFYDLAGLSSELRVVMLSGLNGTILDNQVGIIIRERCRQPLATRAHEHEAKHIRIVVGSLGQLLEKAICRCHQYFQNV